MGPVRTTSAVASRGGTSRGLGVARLVTSVGVALRVHVVTAAEAPRRGGCTTVSDHLPLARVLHVAFDYLVQSSATGDTRACTSSRGPTTPFAGRGGEGVFLKG
jgi:hypothetical protein